MNMEKLDFFIYITSSIEGRDVHNAFWHDVETIWVDGNIRCEYIRFDI